MKLLFSLLTFAIVATCRETSYDNTTIKKYVDDVLIAKYYTSNNKIMTYIIYNKMDSCEIKYKYSNSNKLLKVSFSDKKSCQLYDEIEIKEYKDNQVQQNLLKNEFNIFLRFPEINRGELANITYILSSINNYIDTNIDNERQIIANNINMSYRFNKTDLESFINSNNIISRYIIVLDNNNIKKEEIYFDNGFLTRTYEWQNNLTYKIIINCEYLNSNILKQTKTLIFTPSK